MSHISKRIYIIDAITQSLQQFRNSDYSDIAVKGDVHRTTTNVLLQARMNHIIFDYAVSVHFKDFTNHAAGYEIEIIVWYEAQINKDAFVLLVTPEILKGKEDPAKAYDRAMGII